jgi:hypothetical protein
VIEVQQNKISGELMKLHPSDTLIEGWQPEIEAQERRITPANMVDEVTINKAVELLRRAAPDATITRTGS